jgi:hypothetical protein
MRKRFVRIFILAALPLVIFVFGCSARRIESSPPDSASLVGRWRQTSIATPSQSADCPATLRLPDGGTTSCTDNDVIEFNSNGTFTATFSATPIKASGTWRLSGNTLSLTFAAPSTVSGKSRSTTIRFINGGKAISVNAKLGDTPTIETYSRQ